MGGQLDVNNPTFAWNYKQDSPATLTCSGQAQQQYLLKKITLTERDRQFSLCVKTPERTAIIKNEQARVDKAVGFFDQIKYKIVLETSNFLDRIGVTKATQEVADKVTSGAKGIANYFFWILVVALIAFFVYASVINKVVK